jgi:hypothetical protein
VYFDYHIHGGDDCCLHWRWGSGWFSRTFTFTDTYIPAPAIWIWYKDSDFTTTLADTTSSDSASSTFIDTSSSDDSSSPRSSKPPRVFFPSQLNTGASAILPSTQALPKTISTSKSGSPPSTNLPKTARFSTGAKIGLGLGIPFGIFFAVIFAFILIRRRKRKRASRVSELPGADDDSKRHLGRHELEHSTRTSLPLSELEGARLWEIPQ